MKKKDTKPDHKIAYSEITALLARHADKMSAMEILAIASNLVGKLLAMQDQRTMTPQAGLEMIMRNIELGNQEAIAELMNTPTSGRPQ